MIRLFVSHSFKDQTPLTLDEKQSHYLLHVMRCGEGDGVLAFNGVDGEWLVRMAMQKKKTIQLIFEKKIRAQTQEPDVQLLFAPIKRGHGDVTVEKATELGVTCLSPVITQRTVVTRVPLERYKAIAIEAAEQCERLSVPQIDNVQKLETVIKNWDHSRPLLWCAEEGEAQPIMTAATVLGGKPVSILVGPEGGFTPEELTLLRNQVFVVPVTLGPRILRADTAAVAALALVAATLQ